MKFFRVRGVALPNWSEVGDPSGAAGVPPDGVLPAASWNTMFRLRSWCRGLAAGLLAPNVHLDHLDEMWRVAGGDEQLGQSVRKAGEEGALELVAATFLLDHGDPEKALDIAERALPELDVRFHAALDTGSDIERMRSNLFNLHIVCAQAHGLQRKKDEALQELEAADALCFRPAAVSLVRGLVLQVGRAAASESQAALDRAIELSTDDGETRAWAYHLLANQCRLEGKTGQALEFLDQALRIHIESGNFAAEAQVLDTLGNVHLWNSRPPDLEMARELFNRSYRLKCEMGDRRGLAITSGNLARTELFDGDLEMAGKWCLENLALSKRIGDRDGVVISHQTLGILHRLQGNTREAAKHLLIAQGLSQTHDNTPPNPWGEFIAIAGLVGVAADKKDWGYARDRAQQLSGMLGPGAPPLPPYARAVSQYWNEVAATEGGTGSSAALRIFCAYGSLLAAGDPCKYEQFDALARARAMLVGVPAADDSVLEVRTVISRRSKEAAWGWRLR